MSYLGIKTLVVSTTLPHTNFAQHCTPDLTSTSQIRLDPPVCRPIILWYTMALCLVTAWHILPSISPAHNLLIKQLVSDVQRLFIIFSSLILFTHHSFVICVEVQFNIFFVFYIILLYSNFWYSSIFLFDKLSKFVKNFDSITIYLSDNMSKFVKILTRLY